MQQQQQDSSVHTDLSSAWMPLDGLIQLWATFGNDASDGPQTAAVLQATSQALPPWLRNASPIAATP